MLPNVKKNGKAFEQQANFKFPYRDAADTFFCAHDHQRETRQGSGDIRLMGIYDIFPRAVWTRVLVVIASIVMLVITFFLIHFAGAIAVLAQ